MVEKLRATYSQMTDAKVFNLFKIYLLFNENPRTKCCKNEFLFGWGHIYKKPALLTSTLLTGFFFIFNCGQSKRPLYFKM